jgi:ribosomal protein S18 acetylase RimI-like enzyme
MGELVWRDEVAQADIAAVRRLVAATGFFTAEEIGIAAELVEERLRRGDASGYHFVLAETGGALAGYACFGPIAGTQSAFDLYWIAVDPARQGGGLGRLVLAKAEAAMRRMGASRHYAETSSTERYAPTRGFYLATGFREVACIPDFYRPGDGKVIYERVL